MSRALLALGVAFAAIAVWLWRRASEPLGDRVGSMDWVLESDPDPYTAQYVV